MQALFLVTSASLESDLHLHFVCSYQEIQMHEACRGPTCVWQIWTKPAVTVQSEAVCSSLPVSGLCFPLRILAQSGNLKKAASGELIPSILFHAWRPLIIISIQSHQSFSFFFILVEDNIQQNVIQFKHYCPLRKVLCSPNVELHYRLWTCLRNVS